MIDTFNIINVYDKSKKENVQVKVLASPHAYERFMERSSKFNEIETAINQAVNKIVNYYPHEDAEFIVKSKSAGLKIPMITKVYPDEFRISIPTALDINMKAHLEKVLPNLTVESIQYIMFNEIEVD